MAVRPLTIVVLLIAAGCGAKSELRRIAVPSAPDEMDAAVVRDGGSDGGSDAGEDAGSDTGADAGSDAGFDTGFDGGSDAGRDGGRDAGNDAAVVVSTIGCADGEREGFRDRARYPRIAACSGGWTRPGLAHPAAVTCDGQGGDDGPFPNGGTCGVSDLCAVGWHVCATPREVAASSPDGCAGSHDAADAFFATRISGPGCGVCATGTAPDCGAIDCRTDCAFTSVTVNDIFGCGTLGPPPDPGTCGPLDRFGTNLCSGLPSPWSCTDDGSGTHEAELVIKPGSGAGGVLCCRD